jgi:hypothetical protein
MAGSEISVVTKTYDLLVWLLPHLAKYTRDHRFTLGDRTEVAALAVLESQGGLGAQASRLPRKTI